RQGPRGLPDPRHPKDPLRRPRARRASPARALLAARGAIPRAASLGVFDEGCVAETCSWSWLLRIAGPTGPAVAFSKAADSVCRPCAATVQPRVGTGAQSLGVER